MKRVVFFILFLQLVLNCANIKTYTIAVCTTLDFDGAMNCKRKILKDNNLEVFIVKDKDKKFKTYYGSFKTIDEANNTIKNVSNFIKTEKSFVKELSYDLEQINDNNPLFIAYAYNGGARYTRTQLKKGLFKEKNRFEPFLSMELISYAETREYGKKVLANYYIYNNYLNKENPISLSTIFQSLVSPSY